MSNLSNLKVQPLAFKTTDFYSCIYDMKTTYNNTRQSTRIKRQYKNGKFELIPHNIKQKRKINVLFNSGIYQPTYKSRNESELNRHIEK